jgi:hypothetical protein
MPGPAIQTKPSKSPSVSLRAAQVLHAAPSAGWSSPAVPVLATRAARHSMRIDSSGSAAAARRAGR